MNNFWNKWYINNSELYKRSFRGMTFAKRTFSIIINKIVEKKYCARIDNAIHRLIQVLEIKNKKLIFNKVQGGY